MKHKAQRIGGLDRTVGENELYEQWRNAQETERADLEQLIYQSAMKHGQAVVAQRLQESNCDLVHDIASDVVKQLIRFRGDSKFSTWVHGIAINKINEYLRKRMRARKVFDENANLTELEEGMTRGLCLKDVQDFDENIRLGELGEGLSEDEKQLLSCKYEVMKTKEIATMLGITPHAVESRWQRLKPKVEKNASLTRRTGTVSGN